MNNSSFAGLAIVLADLRKAKRISPKLRTRLEIEVGALYDDDGKQALEICRDLKSPLEKLTRNWRRYMYDKTGSKTMADIVAVRQKLRVLIKTASPIPK